MIDAIALCRTDKYFCDQQIVKVESLMAQHGIFYMENAGGYKPARPEDYSKNGSGRAPAKLFRPGRGKRRTLDRKWRNDAGHQ